MNYRAEIDGLRALAVIPVILFHAGIGLFSGGFVGVDVFFVISGYLITTILVTDIEDGKFSIAHFYERRARRILPALFLVMLCCIPFAWIWMQPEQMQDFAQSLIAVSLFASNILFWRESGYFDAAAEEKPLLHTWSLAVEEQYYLLFPIFLMLAWRYGRHRVFWMIVIVAALSLALSEWGWRNKATANFYLAPTRAWELLAGSIAAFIVLKKGVQENDVLSLAGLAAIIYAIFAYDDSTPFPSLYALVPVVGVVLLVLYGGRGTFAARFLGSKVLVGIGLISYSAYLWHQPLFAFARLRTLETPPMALMLALALLSLGLAFLSWKFIEQPFRNRDRFSRKQIFAFSIIALAFPIMLGVWGHVKHGFDAGTYPVASPDIAPQILLDRELWIFGDSHGDHLIEGFRAVSNQTVRGLIGTGCIPLRDVDRYDFRFEPGACARTMNGFLDEITNSDPDAIVLISTMGPVYLDGMPFKDKDWARVTGLGVELVTNPEITDRWQVFEIGLRNTLAELSALKNATVIFALDVPELGIDYGCAIKSKVLETPWFRLGDFSGLRAEGIREECYVERALYDERVGRYQALVREVVAEYPKIGLFDPTGIFCDEERCAGYREDYGFLYKDVDHLNRAGSVLYATEFAKWMASTK